MRRKYDAPKAYTVEHRIDKLALEVNLLEVFNR